MYILFKSCVFVALRKTMFRAHRQAWAWQDEWHGLTMDDIRELERQTQLALQKKMGLENGSGDEDDGRVKQNLCIHNKLPNFYLFLDPSQSDNEPSKHSKQMSSIEKTEETPMFPKKMHPPVLKEHPPSVDSSEGEESNDEFGDISIKGDRSESLQLASSSKYGSKGALHSPIGSAHSFDLQVCD